MNDCHYCGFNNYDTNRDGIIYCDNCGEKYQPVNFNLIHKAMMVIGK